MKWSKLKFLVEERFAPSLGKRVNLFSTAYGNCTCGRAWLTIDKKEIANFCTRAKFNAKNAESGRKNPPLGFGELSRQDAYKSCWAVVHDLSIAEALKNSDPLVQALAVLDIRCGKRRLMGIQAETLHPLAQKMLNFRLGCEGMEGHVKLPPATIASNRRRDAISGIN